MPAASQEKPAGARIFVPGGSRSNIRRKAEGRCEGQRRGGYAQPDGQPFPAVAGRADAEILPGVTGIAQQQGRNGGAERGQVRRQIADQDKLLAWAGERLGPEQRDKLYCEGVDQNGHADGDQQIPPGDRLRRRLDCGRRCAHDFRALMISGRS